MMDRRPVSTGDLTPTERRLLAAMQQLGFGRFEFLRVERGEPVLDPWPTTVRDVKFGAQRRPRSADAARDFALKKQAAEFFEYVRSTEAGQIRVLRIHDGLPFAMEFELAPSCHAPGGRRG
jgi:hypothetical protein